MALGYTLGRLYVPEVSMEQRKRTLYRLGLAAVVVFIGLRAINGYGDPRPAEDRPTAVFDVLSFLNVTKYPPSLLYLCMTLGPALLFLGWAEGRTLRRSTPFITLGRVPFFYYMVHIYLVQNTLATLAMVLQGQPSAGPSFLFRSTQGACRQRLLPRGRVPGMGGRGGHHLLPVPLVRQLPRGPQGEVVVELSLR